MSHCDDLILILRECNEWHTCSIFMIYTVVCLQRGRHATSPLEIAHVPGQERAGCPGRRLRHGLGPRPGLYSIILVCVLLAVTGRYDKTRATKEMLTRRLTP